MSDWNEDMERTRLVTSLRRELAQSKLEIERAVDGERQMWKNAIRIVLASPDSLKLIGQSPQPNDMREALTPVAGLKQALMAAAERIGTVTAAKAEIETQLAESKQREAELRSKYEPDCYCVCHSPVASRASCEHCNGVNIVGFTALKRERDRAVEAYSKLRPHVYEAGMVPESEYERALVNLDTVMQALAANEPTCDHWKQTLIDACINLHLSCDENDPKATLNKVIEWETKIALDPAVSEDARKLRDTYKQERDVTALRAESAEGLWAWAARERDQAIESLKNCNDPIPVTKCVHGAVISGGGGCTTCDELTKAVAHRLYIPRKNTETKLYSATSKLIEFLTTALDIASDGCDWDGGDIQFKALELGLIVTQLPRPEKDGGDDDNTAVEIREAAGEPPTWWYLSPVVLALKDDSRFDGRL